MFSFRKTISALLFLILFSVVAVAQELTVDYHSANDRYGHGKRKPASGAGLRARKPSGRV